MLTIVLLSIVIASFIFLFFSFIDRKKYPPGPKGYPILGTFPLNFPEQAEALFKKYGDLLMIKFGNKRILYVKDPILGRDLSSRPELNDRPQLSFFKNYKDGKMTEDTKGILLSNGLMWLHGRRFNLKLLRENGLGGTIAEQIMHPELELLFQQFDKKCGKPTILDKEISINVLNVLYRMCASISYSYEDEEYTNMLRLLTEIDHGVRISYAADAFPYLSKILKFVFPSITKIQDIALELYGQVEKNMMVIIKEHEEKLDLNNPKDLIDSYLIEMDKNMNKPDSLFQYDDLIRVIIDMMIAGNESLTILVGWSIIYLIKHPEIQKRIQKQIDKVIPNGKKLSLEERDQLGIVEAFNAEIMRLGQGGAFSFFRAANKDFEVNGYFIPKDTIVHNCIYLMHRDEKFWKNPHEFNIDRWLDANGKFVPISDAYLPFGAGRRICVGLGVSKSWLFLMIGRMLQRYNISAVSGCEVDVKPERVPHKNQCKTQEFILTQRK